MIPQNIVEQVQSACDVVEIISSYIPLKRAGRSFKACCPFHSEKTPSFFVNPEKQIWHCFGCGVGGSIFNFVMQYERVSFPEAVRLLGKKAGIEVPEKREKGERREERKEDFYRLNQFAAAWFAKQLTVTAPGMRVRDYLRTRGVDERMVELLSLGYAPEPWDALTKAARAKGYGEEALLALGLSMRKEGGQRVYDRFRNRLMIPICDVNGRVIAFSGRVVGQGEPKYMNSPESVLFSKGRSLYGLNLSKRSIVDSGYAIVVEGYFDFLALYAAGIQNVVASQGTAFTPDHARLIKRFTSDIIMCFDPDTAGASATELHGLDALLSEEGLTVRVLVLPQGNDPDIFIHRGGKGAFNELAKKAPAYFDFLIELLCARHNAKTEVGKARAADTFLRSLALVKDAVYREAYLKKFSESVGISLGSLIQEINRKPRLRPQDVRHEKEDSREDTPLPAGEKEIVRLMLEDEKAIAQAAAALSPEDFRDGRLQRIARSAFEMVKQNRWAGCGRLVACLDDERCARVVSRLMAEEERGGDRERAVKECIVYLKRRNLREEIGRITREITRREKEDASGKEILKLQRLLMEKRKEADMLKVSL